jgi:hypothetical protein
MGFLFRALFVIGILYLVSPMRAPLPAWLATPSSTAIELAAAPASVVPAAKSSAPAAVATIASIGQTVATVCKGHENACADAAASSLKAASSDDPLAALVKDALGNGSGPVQKAQPLALADAVDTPAIPLPPRRDASAPTLAPQKKI